MKKEYIFSIFIFSSIFALDIDSSYPNLEEPKIQEPNWRHEILNKFDNGNPYEIIFYEPISELEDIPAKKNYFYENGNIKTEIDIQLITNEKGESKIVSQGFKIEYYEDRSVKQTNKYENDLLQGEEKQFSPKGRVTLICNYKDDKLQGDFLSFYENGSKKEIGFYENGLLDGDYCYYFPGGNKSLCIPNKDGLINGVVLEWYENGEIKSKKYFKDNKLNGSNDNCALISYDQQGAIIETLNFIEGFAEGLHVQYHSNGVEAYRCLYKEGQKDGVESFFNKEGVLEGSGKFKKGVSIGKHWKKYKNDQLCFESYCDDEGNLIKPIVEYYENGKEKRIFLFNKEGKLDSNYKEWYEDGKLKADLNYKEGFLNGNQLKFFQNGQIHIKSFYEDNKQIGEYQEWHENGLLSKQAFVKNDHFNGKNGEWYESGIPKSESNYKEGKLQGEQMKWYENGNLQMQVEYDNGQKNGYHREWNEKNKLILLSFYQEEKLESDLYMWYDNGKMKSHFKYKNGQRDGDQKWFYENGKYERVANFIDDKIDGKIVSWYNNGLISAIQYFNKGTPVKTHTEFHNAYKENKKQSKSKIFKYDEEGRLHGLQKSFFENGQKEFKISYEHGVLHGDRLFWNDVNELMEKAYFVNGKLEGEYFKIFEDGKKLIFNYKNNLKNGPYSISFLEKKLLEGWYKDNKLEGLLVEYDQNGGKVSEINYSKGKKNDKATFYEEGVAVLTVPFKDDVKHGKAYQYFPTREIYKEIDYLMDKKEGEEKTFFKSGQLSYLSYYNNNKLEGVSKAWNEQGINIFECEYKSGMKNGFMKKYYDDGTVFLEQYFKDDKLHGEKKKFDKNGHLTINIYEDGKVIH